MVFWALRSSDGTNLPPIIVNLPKAVRWGIRVFFLRKASRGSVFGCAEHFLNVTNALDCGVTCPD